MDFHYGYVWERCIVLKDKEGKRVVAYDYEKQLNSNSAFQGTG